MPLHILNSKIWFPPVEEATSEGLLAVGGDLSIERILYAYKNGIFPWYEDEIPLWWYPDPRCVLFPQNLKVSKSMNQLLKKNTFEFRRNTAFKQVLQQCKNIKRPNQKGTWITEDVEESYTELHKLGYVQSAEAWLNGKLVGGLYGMRLGNVFYGESMFSHENNASKFAFIKYVDYLVNEGVTLIDCQVYTTHLETLGAELISGAEFKKLLKANFESSDKLFMAEVL